MKINYIESISMSGKDEPKNSLKKNYIYSFKLKQDLLKRTNVEHTLIYFGTMILLKTWSATCHYCVPMTLWYSLKTKDETNLYKLELGEITVVLLFRLSTWQNILCN